MFSLLKALKNLRRLQRNVDNSLQKEALRALVAIELKSYIAILALPKHKNNHTTVELKLLFLASLQQCTSIDRCVLQLRAKKKKKNTLHSHYFFYFLFFLAFILLSLCLSPHCLSVSSFFLHRPFFLPHRPIADLHKPNHHRPIARRPTLSRQPDPFQPLFSIFGVSSLCFGFVFRAGFLFWAWVSVFVSDQVCVQVVIFLLSFFVLLHWF